MRFLGGKLLLLTMSLVMGLVAASRQLVPAAASGDEVPLVPLLPNYREWGSIPTDIINFRAALADWNQDRLYVVNRRGLTVFDTRSQKQIGTLEAGAGDALTLSRDGQRLYIFGLTDATSIPSHLTVVDTATFELRSPITVPCDTGVAYCQITGVATGPNARVYVTTTYSNGFLALDGESGAYLRTVSAPDIDPARILTTRGNHLYSYHPHYGYGDGDEMLARWDISTVDPVLLTSSPIEEPFPSALLASPDDTFLISSADYYGMTIYDPATLQITGAVLNDGMGFAGVPELFYEGVDIAADSRSILAQVSTNGALVMLEFDLSTLAPIRSAKSSPYYAYYPRGMVALAGGDVAQVYSDRVALLSPTDYVAAVPAMFSAQCDPGEIVDRFDDPSSGWPIFDNGATAVGYAEDTYRILQRQPDRLTAVTRGDFWANSLLFEVSAWLPSGKGSYGIIFGWADDGSEYYILRIFPDSKPENREAHLLHYTAVAGWELLQAFELPTVINPGAERNVMRLAPYPDDNGHPTVGIYVNDYWLPTLLPYFIGRIGLIGASSPEAASELRFDDYHFIGRDCTRPAGMAAGATAILRIEGSSLGGMSQPLETGQPSGARQPVIHRGTADR